MRIRTLIGLLAFFSTAGGSAAIHQRVEASKTSVPPLDVQAFRLGGQRQTPACPIRIDGRTSRCEVITGSGKREHLVASGRFGWPSVGIDGLACSEAFCLAADRSGIDLYFSKGSRSASLRRVILFRRKGDVLSVALSYRDSEDRRWLGYIDNGLSDSDRKKAEAFMRNYFVKRA